MTAPSHSDFADEWPDAETYGEAAATYLVQLVQEHSWGVLPLGTQCDVCWSTSRPVTRYVAQATGARGVACLDEQACARDFASRPKGARRADHA